MDLLVKRFFLQTSLLSIKTSIFFFSLSVFPLLSLTPAAEFRRGQLKLKHSNLPLSFLGTESFTFSDSWNFQPVSDNNLSVSNLHHLSLSLSLSFERQRFERQRQGEENWFGFIRQVLGVQAVQAPTSKEQPPFESRVKVIL